ncbi:MAG TPA: hypothetical protein VFP65_21505 [Anaeromyxobacteraceae bacterium]|nr:hypothetical protein [Anaeromyxobacteraceae bacterium]
MRRTFEAVTVAAALVLGARAGASVQAEPVARLGLEGGYDSNVLYDGRGDAVGRVSPDLGVLVRDHTWNLRMAAGGDLLTYRNGDTSVWNQRGEFALRSRFSERLALDAGADGAYAFDPLGLARFGIFGRTGSALLLRGDARLAWRTERDWRISGTYRERLVAFSDGTGSAGHTPGVEGVYRFGRRWEAGGAYRFDFFQGIGPGSFDATAQELQGVARWRWTRRWRMELEGGPVFWNGPTGQFLIPQAAVRLYWTHPRLGEARVSASHGVGLGYLAEPGLFDSVEGAVTTRLGRRWQLHVDGGIWRSGRIPWGADAVIGYGLQGELAYRVGGGVTVGVGGSRFARADLTTTQFDRTTLGLRVAWELQRRQERH